MITYSSVISYFKEFADKHLQLNSFSYGAVDKIELKKINEYPALHITLTNTDISDKVVVYDFDVYVITGISQQSEEDEQVKESAYSDMLMIMQDLRAEFTEGKYIVDTNLLLLQGSNELSCTPIEEKFNNMVIGFSTSMSVESANETTECTIPYPKYEGENILEKWNYQTITYPVMEQFDSAFYWWSATEQVQNNLSYSGAGIQTVTALAKHNFLTDDFLTHNEFTESGAIRFNSDFRGLEFNATQKDYNLKNTFSNYHGKQLYVGLKVKNISDTLTVANNLLSITTTTETRGINLYVSENRLILQDIATNTLVSAGDISDGSNEYAREDSITIGVLFYGDSIGAAYADKCIVYLDGNEVATVDTDGASITNIIVGSQKAQSDAKFLLQECYVKQINSSSSKADHFPKLLKWLKNR